SLWIKSTDGTIARIFIRHGVGIGPDGKTPDIAIASGISGIALMVNTGVFPDCQIEKICSRVIRRCVPVGRSLDAGVNAVSFEGGFHAGPSDRTALLIQAIGPGDVGKCLAEQVLACDPVEHVIKTVAIAPPQ